MVQTSKATARALPAEMHEHTPKARTEGDDEEEQVQGEPESLEPEEDELSAPTSQEPVQVSVRAQQAAIKRAAAESQTIGGRPNPAMERSETATRPLAARLAVAKGMDLSKMSKAEMLDMVQTLLEERRRAPGIALQKMIRWNNGSDPNFAENGEVVSARDTGSISVYGFARRPTTFYAGQWVALAHYMQDILHFIEKNLEDINQYVSQRLGNESKRLEPEDVEKALALFATEQSGGADRAAA